MVPPSFTVRKSCIKAMISIARNALTKMISIVNPYRFSRLGSQKFSVINRNIESPSIAIMPKNETKKINWYFTIVSHIFLNITTSRLFACYQNSSNNLQKWYIYYSSLYPRILLILYHFYSHQSK